MAQDFFPPPNVYSSGFPISLYYHLAKKPTRDRCPIRLMLALTIVLNGAGAASCYGEVLKPNRAVTGTYNFNRSSPS